MLTAAVAAAAEPERILVSRLRYAGDALLSLPLVSALRARWPRATLHYLAEAPTLAVLRTQPEIDRLWVAPRGAGATLALASRLHRERFDAVIDLFCNPRSALLVLATAAPVRIGERRRIRRHAYTVARRLVPGRSAIDQHLDAMRALGAEPPPASRPILHLEPGERRAGLDAWRSAAGGPGVLVHLGATHADKEWPHAASFARALAASGTRAAVSTVPLRPEPGVQAAEASGLPRFPPLALRDFLAVVAAATAVVSVDGAIVHAAVALERPTLALFGPTDPAVWFPYAGFGPYRVLRAAAGCARCGGAAAPHTCMAALAPESVLDALAAVQAGDR